MCVKLLFLAEQGFDYARTEAMNAVACSLTTKPAVTAASYSAQDVHTVFFVVSIASTASDADAKVLFCTATILKPERLIAIQFSTFEFAPPLTVIMLGCETFVATTPVITITQFLIVPKFCFAIPAAALFELFAP